jgi:SAM-dependent methyltransferase
MRAVLSPKLRAFVAELPAERRRILSFVSAVARELPQGTRILDAGAGDAPYRELFAHCDYVTSDWAESPHAGARAADVIAPLDALPLEDASFDAVLSTQVLEHVERPDLALGELLRVLRPGGRLWLTAPFMGELHEEPYDFFRYTRHGLRSLLERSGFERVDIEPLGGYFTALAVMLNNCGVSIGARRDVRDLPRRLLAAALRLLARALPRLDGLDTRRALPVGYGCRAERPASTRS